MGIPIWYVKLPEFLYQISFWSLCSVDVIHITNKLIKSFDVSNECKVAKMNERPHFAAHSVKPYMGTLSRYSWSAAIDRWLISPKLLHYSYIVPSQVRLSPEKASDVAVATSIKASMFADIAQSTANGTSLNQIIRAPWFVQMFCLRCAAAMPL